MNPFQGPVINKVNGSLGRTAANTDRVIGFIAGGVATTELAINTPVRILSLPQANSLLLNESYDANNDVLVYDHLKEAFRLNPNAEIILMITAIPTTKAEMLAWFAVNGIIETYLTKQVAKDVKTIFTAFNIDAGDLGTAVGIADEVLASIPVAQNLVNRQFTANRYIDDIVLDGVYVESVDDLEDLRALDKPNIQVLIASDAYVNLNYAKQAAIGAAMGMLGVRQINENLGSVEVINPPALFKGKENYPLSDGIRFADAFIVGKDITTASLPAATLGAINDKGYIFAAQFAGYDGFYFSGDPTCADITSDYAYGNNNSVWNKAARLVRAALIPKVRSVLKKDPATGFLRPTTASSLEQTAQTALNTGLIAPDLCSDAKVAINAEQTPNDTTPLEVQVQVVKDGILHTMEVNISLNNSISI